MKKFALILALGVIGLASMANAGLIITGIVDGPRSGGLPKALEIYADGTVDLTGWSVKNANNGSSTWINPTALSGTVTDDFIYVSYETTGFEAYFGFSPDYTGSVINHNGDDTIGLFYNDVLVDIVGQLGVDGTGTDWESLDSYLYREDGEGPNTTWTASEWTNPGINYLDAQGTTGVNGGAGITVPFGTYQVPDPATIALLTLSGVALIRRRK